MLYLLVVSLAILGGVCHCAQDGGHCSPEMSCWPTYQDFLNLIGSLDGSFAFPVDEKYRELTVMYNTRTTRMPYIVIVANTTSDVVKGVKFARKFNMKLSIRSSGHDYIGRSTADMSVQINLSEMKGLTFNLNSTRNAAGELKAQSGNTWIRVYNETSKRGRVIVGGSAHTVSMGGYTLGGGHSPIGRKFGMAVDNLLGVEMVTANGSIVYADDKSTVLVDTGSGQRYETTNTDIFWAVRGGGGSTFGIVTEFTYKLHYDSEMVTLQCYAPFYRPYPPVPAGRGLIEDFYHLASTSLAPEWGGYQIFSEGAAPNTLDKGSVFLSLNHFGKWGSPSFDTILPFLNKNRDHCQLKNVSNFLEYEIGAKDPIYFASYIFNTLMQPDSFTSDFYTYILDLMLRKLPVEGSLGCTGALIGGNMKNIDADATAVSPNFRSATISLTCGLAWSSQEEDGHVTYAEKLTNELLNFGNGTYFNEPSAFLQDWKAAYWGGHYDRLLRIKADWDPDNVFSCLHCVGSDMKKVTASNHNGGMPIVG